MNEDFRSVKLPSKCRTYKGVDLQSISIRTLTGEEERILAETNVSNFDKKILDILKRVVKGVDVSLLTLGDRLFILVWEAMNSFSDDLPIVYVCSSCGRENRSIGKFSEVDSKELSDTFIEPVEVGLSNGRLVKLRLLTAGDAIKISDYESSGGDGWCYRYALSIVNEEDVLSRMSFYKNLPIKDTARIRSFQEEFYHGPDMQFKMICSNCREEELVFVPFRPEFLLPTGQELIRNYGSGIHSDVVPKNV